MTGYVALADVDDLAPGTALIVDHGGQKVLLVRVDDGVRAFDGRCPHARTVLAGGPLVDGAFIECPMHGAVFAARDGALQPGPVTCRGLTAWPVRVEDGRISVDVPERRADPRGGWRPPSWGAVGARTASAQTTT
jgi:apoptosis-inducing factor 3